MDTEKKEVRRIKKYANRKLYDMTDKRYVSLERLSMLIKEGEEVVIEDNETGEDITGTVVSQLLAREKKGEDGDTPTSILFQLLRKGRGTVTDYAKRYSGLWQNAVTMAEDEIDKLVNILVKDKEITESEGSRLKREMQGYAGNFRKWMGEKIDQRVTEVMKMMNLASREEVEALAEELKVLSGRVAALEKAAKEPPKPAGASTEEIASSRKGK